MSKGNDKKRIRQYDDIQKQATEWHKNKSGGKKKDERKTTQTRKKSATEPHRELSFIGHVQVCFVMVAENLV